MPAALCVQNLWKSYAAGVAGCSARVWALRGCSFSVMAGERVAIVGAAASGKSTLLRCLSGHLRQDAGRLDLRASVSRGTAGSQYQSEGSVLYLVDDEHDCIARVREVHPRRGDSVLVAARSVASIQGQVDRVLLLRDGRVTPLVAVGGEPAVGRRAVWASA